MRVLVTGGAGFIGSNLVGTLLARGHDVGVVDNLSTGRRDNLAPEVWFRELDILDTALQDAVAEFAPEAVVHLAAQASVSESLRDPERDWAVNAEGTRLVAAAARQVGVQRMVSASSAAVYGEPDEADLPLKETARKAPANPYGKSKLAAEGLMAAELAGSPTDFASFRFSNVYGPGQDGAGEGGVVAIFCTRLRDDVAPVIYGSGGQTRDFIYVGDVVEAIIAAAEASGSLASMGSGADAASYNISTGAETSVNGLLDALRAASAKMGEPIFLPARDGDVDRSSLDPAKALGAFGWHAVAPLERGVTSTWRWFGGHA
ncbi:MAG: NAD-dependent epimerase/dehydratase family protein [Coriobacteriia bacterium]|nr:NAD-dependent epimerase/dehydratase family protein [Coriobacteriia bacterium]